MKGNLTIQETFKGVCDNGLNINNLFIHGGCNKRNGGVLCVLDAYNNHGNSCMDFEYNGEYTRLDKRFCTICKNWVGISQIHAIKIVNALNEVKARKISIDRIDYDKLCDPQSNCISTPLLHLIKKPFNRFENIDIVIEKE